MEFFVTLLKGWLPVKQCHKKLSLECCGVLYAPMTNINIIVRKNSLPNELFYHFQQTSVKHEKKNVLAKTCGWGMLTGSFN